MNKFRQMSVATRIVLMFGLICCFLAANGALIFFSLRTIEGRNDKLQSKMLHEWKISNDIAKNLGLLQSEVFRHVLITDAEGMRVHDRIIRHIRDTNTDKLAEYKQLIDDDPASRWKWNFPCATQAASFARF